MNEKWMYILIGKEPVAVDDVLLWGKFHQSEDRILKKTAVNGYKVSTVFLGIDQNFTNGGRPLVFETMIFPGCDYSKWYETYDEAMEGHDKIVEDLKNGKIDA